MRSLLLGPAVVLGLAASGCNEATEPSPVIGGTWRLAQLDAADGTRRIPPDPGRYTVSFGADGGLGARADCNTCGGSYSLSGSALNVSDLACTLIACGQPSLDGPFLALLVGQSTAEVDGGALTIASARGTLRLTR